MYDMTKLIKRTWEITFIDGKKLNILPPKLSQRYEMIDLLNNNNKDYLNSLSKATSMIVSINKENVTYSKEYIDKLMNEDEMIDFINNYTDWLNGVTSEKN